MWSIWQEEKNQVWLLLLNVPRVECDIAGVVAPDMTENKIGSEARADDIKSDKFDRKIWDSLPVSSD